MTSTQCVISLADVNRGGFERDLPEVDKSNQPERHLARNDGGDDTGVVAQSFLR